MINDDSRRDDQTTPPHSGDAVSSISTLVESGLPLESGLRALSEEAPTRRMRNILRQMSDELAKGASAETVLAQGSGGMPKYLRGLVKAGVQSGQLGSYLEEFLLSLRRRRSARQTYLIALAYPLLLVPFTLLVASGLILLIVPQFKEIFNDFGVELPGITLLLVSLSDLLSPVVLIVFAGVVLLIPIIIRLLPYLFGPAFWTRMVQSLPLIGTPSKMRGMSEFCSFLGLLVSGGLPLPDALKITSGVLNDSNLKTGTRKLASRVESGETLQEGAGRLPHFSAELRSLFHWEQRGTTFGEMLRQAGEVFAARSQVQVGIVGMIFQPFLLFVVGAVLVLTVGGLFMPLIKLLNELS